MGRGACVGKNPSASHSNGSTPAGMLAGPPCPLGVMAATPSFTRVGGGGVVALDGRRPGHIGSDVRVRVVGGSDWAGVAKLVDARDLKSLGGNPVRVRDPPLA